jgi:catechol 2,3-dioxygenase-like lactoylglutathione lyase family enzyme
MHHGTQGRRGLDQLPFALAVALRLRDAGVGDALIAHALAIEPEGVSALLKVAEAKLRRVQSNTSTALLKTGPERPPTLPPMNDMELDNIGLGTHDLARTLAFYEQLGFAVTSRSTRGATIVLGHAKLFVFIARQARLPRRSADPLANPPGLDHLSFAVADVDAAYGRLSANGVEFDCASADTDWGARAGCLRDPDGTSLFLLTWQTPG